MLFTDKLRQQTRNSEAPTKYRQVLYTIYVQRRVAKTRWSATTAAYGSIAQSHLFRKREHLTIEEFRRLGEHDTLFLWGYCISRPDAEHRDWSTPLNKTNFNQTYKLQLKIFQ